MIILGTSEFPLLRAPLFFSTVQDLDRQAATGIIALLFLFFRDSEYCFFGGILSDAAECWLLYVSSSESRAASAKKDHRDEGNREGLERSICAHKIGFARRVQIRKRS